MNEQMRAAIKAATVRVTGEKGNGQGVHLVRHEGLHIFGSDLWF